MTKVHYSPAILDVRALSLNTLFKARHGWPGGERRAARARRRINQTDSSANSNAPNIVKAAPTAYATDNTRYLVKVRKCPCA